MDLVTLWQSLPGDLKGCVGWYLQFKNPPTPPPASGYSFQKDISLKAVRIDYLIDIVDNYRHCQFCGHRWELRPVYWISEKDWVTVRCICGECRHRAMSYVDEYKVIPPDLLAIGRGV